MMPAIPLILLMLLMLTVTTGEKLPNPNPRKLCWLYGKKMKQQEKSIVIRA